MSDFPIVNIFTFIVAAVSVNFSYMLAKRIYDGIKSDEVLVAGHLFRVDLL
ncbi:MAG: hypothetical protein AB8B95_10680 [Pseudohongiellaceae bacterium]